MGDDDDDNDDDFVYNYLDVRNEVGGISSFNIHMLYTPQSMTYYHDLYHIISHNISPICTQQRQCTNQSK